MGLFDNIDLGVSFDGIFDGVFPARRRAATAEADLQKAQQDKAKLQKQAADVTNDLRSFRQRSEAETERQRLFANSEFAKSMIAVLDDIDRAIEAAGTAKTQQADSLDGLAKRAITTLCGKYRIWYARPRDEFVKVEDLTVPVVESMRKHAEGNEAIAESLSMLRDGFLRALASHNVTPIDVNEGDEFDPNLHEAVAKLEIDDEHTGTGTIVRTIAAGYMIHDRVLRAAKVAIVA